MRPDKAVVIDLETTGLEWSDHVLTVNASVVEPLHQEARDTAYLDTLTPMHMGTDAHRETWYADPTSRPDDPASAMAYDTNNGIGITAHCPELGITISSSGMNAGIRSLLEQPVSHPTLTAYIDRLMDGAGEVVYHNGSFDLSLLLKMGLMNYADYREGKVSLFDTMLMARNTGPRNLGVGLDDLKAEYGYQTALHSHADYAQMKAARGKLAQFGEEKVLRYGTEDTFLTGLLYNRLRETAEDMYSDSWLLEEGQYVAAIANMRYVGHGINRDELLQQRGIKEKEYNERLMRLMERGIDGPNSKEKLPTWMRLQGLPAMTTGNGNAKTAEDDLKQAHPPFVRYQELMAEPEGWSKEDIAFIREEDERGISPVLYDVIEARALKKQVSTWVDGFLQADDGSGRVHPLWSAGGTVSSRLSCRRPNSQAIPGSMPVWGADDGWALYEADWSQAELRYGAGLAKENAMAVMFANGIDVHQGTADLMTKLSAHTVARTIGKRSNFTGFYGGGAPALAEALGMTVAETTPIIKLWRDSYPNVWATSKRAERLWKDRGYLILAHGKRLYASADDIQYRIYKAFNQLVQGSIAEIIKRAMLDIERAFPPDEVRIVAQIHDSLRLETIDRPDAEEVYIDPIREIMRQSAPADILQRTTPAIDMVVDKKLIYRRE